jgi:hypothetical protein
MLLRLWRSFFTGDEEAYSCMTEADILQQELTGFQNLLFTRKILARIAILWL